jgi:hypothetical protein
MSVPSQSPTEPLTWPNLDECYLLTKEALADQLAQSRALDSKASFVLTSASILTAAALALHQAVAGLAGTGAVATLPGGLVVLAKVLAVLAVLAYLAVIYTAFRAYTLRSYDGPADPRQLASKYVDMDSELAKATLFATMVKSYGENSTVLDQKVAWTRYALYALFGESILIALITIVELFLN